MFKKSVSIILSVAVLLSMPFSAFSNGFSTHDYLYPGVDNTELNLSNQTFSSPDGTFNQGSSNFRTVEFIDNYPYWSPAFVYLDSLTFKGATSFLDLPTVYGDNDFLLTQKYVARNMIYEDSLFKVQDFSSMTSSSDTPGTEITGSNFNGSTDIDVASGGSLTINDSTINLASDDVMSKWFGLDNPDPNNIFHRFYFTFLCSYPLASAPSSNSDPFLFSSPFWTPKMAWFDVSSAPSLPLYLLDSSGFNYVPYSNKICYGAPSSGDLMNLPVTSGNFSYFLLFFINPLLRSFCQYKISSSRTYDYYYSANTFPTRWTIILPFEITRLTASKVNERPVITSEKVYCTLPALIDIAINNVVQVMIQIFNVFADWYYPLSNLDSLYWTYYNTDTGKEERINLAGLMYNISWYLGEMYLMNDWKAGEDLAKPGQDLNDTITDLDNAESAITDTVAGHISGFAPDSSIIAGLAAIALVADWLQRIFVALGAYSVPITVSLLLGVCMQFIGYFKYKTG